MAASGNLGKTLQQLKDEAEVKIKESFEELLQHTREAYVYNTEFRDRRQWKLNALVAMLDELVALRRFE